MLRWGSVQAPSATFRSKVSKMAKLPASDGQNIKVPELKPQAATVAVSKRRGPGKSRSQAWAKIDAGKGTWKPK
jgi:hypothetical protein